MYSCLKNIPSELTQKPHFVLILDKHPIRANNHKTFKTAFCTLSGMLLEAGNRWKSPVISAVVAANFLIDKNVKWRKIVYALNPNFNCFLWKIWCVYHVDIAFTGHWHRGIVYKFLLSCLSCSYMKQCDELRKILLINSSFNWSTLTAIQISTMAAPEKTSKARFAVWLQIH